MDKDYAVSVKIQNGRLLRKMKDAGYTSVNQLAKAMGVQPAPIGQILNFKISALRKDDSFRKLVLKLSEHLKCLPEDIIPVKHWTTTLKTNTAVIEMSEPDVASLFYEKTFQEPDVFKVEDKTKMEETISQVLNTLTPREERVIRMKYGFDHEATSIRDIAESLDITYTRVQQIEDRALRRLRFSNRQKNLKPFLFDKDDHY